MFDPTEEPPIRLRDVPKIKWLPPRRGGGRLNIATVFRWTKRGVRGVVLETICIGNTRCTSEAALVRFFQRLAMPKSTPPGTRTPAERAAAHARVTAALKAAGI